MIFPFEALRFFVENVSVVPLEPWIAAESFRVFFVPGSGAFFALGMPKRWEESFEDLLLAAGTNLGCDYVRHCHTPTLDALSSTHWPCERDV